MKPKYFAILRDANNPLWKEYITWLNKTYKGIFVGCYDEYYGYDGNVKCYTSISSFKNNPTILTLEEWKILLTKEQVFTIEDLANGKCAVINDGTLEELKQILRLAFPEDDSPIEGMHKYYYKFPLSNNWDACDRTERVKQSIKKFLKQIKMKKKIIGYKLIKPEYENAAVEICKSKPNFFIKHFKTNCYNYAFEKDSKCTNFLQEAGVLDLWFEPVYQQEYKIGDYIYIISNDSALSCILSDTEKYHYGQSINTIVKIEGITFKDGMASEKDPRYYGENWNLRAKDFRLATQEEIESLHIKTISVGGKFDVTIKNGEVWHKNDNITSFVKVVCSFFSGTIQAYHYNVDIKDVTFSRIGCQNVETKLSDWIKVLNEI